MSQGITGKFCFDGPSLCSRKHRLFGPNPMYAGMLIYSPLLCIALLIGSFLGCVCGNFILISPTWTPMVTDFFSFLIH